MKPFEQATTEELRALWEEKHGTPEIVPAEPLTEPLGFRERYYCVVESGAVDESLWDGDSVDDHRLKDKNVFPYTPEGKAGAKLRDKVPHPGLHWQEDLKKLKQARIEWGESDFHYPHAEIPLVNAVISFLDKYLTE